MTAASSSDLTVGFSTSFSFRSLAPGRAREVGALVATEPREATVKGPTLFARGTRLYLSLVQVTF